MSLFYLTAVFVGMPILELFLLLKVGAAIGPFRTFLLVIATGVVGAWLARQQGLRTVIGIQRDMHEGRTPAGRMLDGVLILVAGLLLITPGLITDVVGFSLLVPVVRALLRTWLGYTLEKKLREGSARVEFRREW